MPPALTSKLDQHPDLPEILRSVDGGEPVLAVARRFNVAESTLRNYLRLRARAQEAHTEEPLVNVLEVPRMGAAGFVASCGGRDTGDLRASSMFMLALFGPTPYSMAPIGTVTAEQIVAAEQRVARQYPGWQLNDGEPHDDPHARLREHFDSRQRLTRKRAAARDAALRSWRAAEDAHRAETIADLNARLRQVWDDVPRAGEPKQ